MALVFSWIFNILANTFSKIEMNMWQNVRKWWTLQQLHRERKRQSGEPLSFANAVACVQDVLICLPENEKEFRVARYVLKSLPPEDEHHRITYVIPKSFAGKISVRKNDRTIMFNGTSRDELGRFTDELHQQVMQYTFQAAVDLNTSFDFGTSLLCYESQADLRIGFASNHSQIFYNVEIAKPEEQFLLERAYRSIQKLLSLI